MRICLHARACVRATKAMKATDMQMAASDMIYGYQLATFVSKTYLGSAIDRIISIDIQNHISSFVHAWLVHAVQC